VDEPPGPLAACADRSARRTQRAVRTFRKVVSGRDQAPAACRRPVTGTRWVPRRGAASACPRRRWDRGRRR
jgi:hypothetical protein